jgi:hypothetical protein
MPKDQPSKILIKANAFLVPSHPNQVVDILINGIKVADQYLLTKQHGNTLEIKLPAGPKPVGEPLLIEFRSLDAISPMAAGISPDDRKLGIGLISVQFAR